MTVPLREVRPALEQGNVPILPAADDELVDDELGDDNFGRPLTEEDRAHIQCNVPGGHILHMLVEQLRSSVADEDDSDVGARLRSFTVQWLMENYESVSIQKLTSRGVVWAHYRNFCQAHGISGCQVKWFGSTVRAVFPKVRLRRTGARNAASSG